jgi:hypothetical protein
MNPCLLSPHGQRAIICIFFLKRLDSLLFASIIANIPTGVLP